MTEKSPNSETSYLDGVKPAETGAETPASPDRDEDASPKSMLEAIQQRMTEGETEGGESSTPSEGQAEKVGAKPEDKPGEKPAAKPEGEGDDQDAQLPFHKHPRWIERTQEIKALRPKAEAFEAIQRGIQDRGLSLEDADKAFELWTLIHNDPAEALKVLKPFVQQAQTLTGEALPDDLKQAVDKGEITEELAKQFAKDRGALTQTKAIQERTHQTAAQRARLSAKETADRLWSDWESTDPDFSALKGMVFDGFKARLFEAQRTGQPVDVTRMFNDTLEASRKTLRSIRGTRPEVNPRTPANPGGNPTGVTKPNSLLDAMKQGAAGTYVPA